MADYPTNSLIIGAVLLALCIAVVFVGLVMATNRKKANAEDNRKRAESARVAREKTTTMMQERRKTYGSAGGSHRGDSSDNAALSTGIALAGAGYSDSGSSGGGYDSGSSCGSSDSGSSGGDGGGGGGCD